MTPEQLRVRKRLYDDFEFYAQHALKIRTKEGEVKPFTLNVAQKALLDAVLNQLQAEGKVRIVILKARQMGLSTLVGGWLYWYISQHTAQKSLVVTHHADSTRALFDMTKRYYEHTPDILKPHSKYSSRKELNFDVLDSSYVVATAGGDGIARGETFTQAHLSELAFWPNATAKDNLNAILQAIPNTKNTAIYIESTANGVSGPFYEIWKGACEGINGFVPVFLPWFIQDEYREPVPKKFVRTPDEEDLVKKHSLDDEQLMFRRKKVAQNGLELFQQEYPSTAEEAFLTSGRPVFNTQVLQQRIEETPDILQRLAMENEEWVEHPRGELITYRIHDPGETYYIGADVSMGVRGGDWSVAQVFDSKKRQVAIFRSQVHPDFFAEVLAALGYFYNTAKLIIESNNHGILTCTRVGKDYAYPNFYTEVVYDKLSDKETIKLGFHTNVKTKPLIIDQLRASLREGEVELNDKVTIRELMTYIVNENGAMEAERGCHDDCVMSLALVNHIHEGKFDPVEITDEFYFEGI
jgi:hypothetical protein